MVEIDHVISTSVNATVISWSPPIEPNGVITGYEIVYSVYGLDAESVIGPLESDLYTINITGLSEYYVNSSLCITYIWSYMCSYYHIYISQSCVF